MADIWPIKTAKTNVVLKPRLAERWHARMGLIASAIAVAGRVGMRSILVRCIGHIPDSQIQNPLTRLRKCEEARCTLQCTTNRECYVCAGSRCEELEVASNPEMHFRKLADQASPNRKRHRKGFAFRAATKDVT